VEAPVTLLTREEQRRQADGWQWWPSYCKAVHARQKAERESLQATERAVREWIHGQ
jgi:hypothetical protein